MSLLHQSKAAGCGGHMPAALREAEPPSAGGGAAKGRPMINGRSAAVLQCPENALLSAKPAAIAALDCQV
jgi:hypothetical protein